MRTKKITTSLDASTSLEGSPRVEEIGAGGNLIAQDPVIDPSAPSTELRHLPGHAGSNNLPRVHVTSQAVAKSGLGVGVAALLGIGAGIVAPAQAAEAAAPLPEADDAARAEHESIARDVLGLPAATEATAATAATEPTADTPSDSAIAEAFNAGLEQGAERRRLAAKIGMAPGELLVSSKIPIVRNIGETLKSVGRAVSAPFTLVSGAVTLDGDRAKDGLDDFARGLLGVVGLEHAIMGDYTEPGGEITGGLALPGHYAKSIAHAKSEWRTYPRDERERDYHHGMKKWHTLSNTKLAGAAGITELPWLFLGGVAHEVDPRGASAEIGGQGFGSWLWDSPLDVVANTMGMLGGLLLPDGAHKEYARVVGNIIPGPTDPFEGVTGGSSKPDTEIAPSSSTTHE
ncbi:MAG: hypothetical protein IT384_02410 [Deltaproteobacteria bacterium]|nr:hypothetical protein [Deltaproteobacteria bacterium]